MNTLRPIVRAFYDIQKLRIMVGLRLCANFKSKLGMTFNTPEDEQDPKANEVMKKLRQSYKKFTDGVMEFPKRKGFKGDAIISAYGEFLLVTSYVELEKQEDRLLKEIQAELEEIKIYRLFLKDVRGIGPILGGVIVAEIDIHRAKHPSSLWKFAGLDVAEDGRGRGKYKDHCVTVSHINWLAQSTWVSWLDWLAQCQWFALSGRLIPSRLNEKTPQLFDLIGRYGRRDRKAFPAGFPAIKMCF